MAKKKKQRSKQQQSSSKSSDSFANNPFAALGKERKAKRAAAAAAPAPPPEPEPEPVAPKLSDAELFASAMDDLGGVDLFQHKFGAGSGSSSSGGEEEAERVDASDVDPALLDPSLRSGAELFAAEMSMAGVARLDDDGKRPFIEPERPSLSRENIPTPASASSVSLNGAERKLISSARRAERRDGALPELSLRGMAREPALEALESFLKVTCVGATYARVIPGKGLRSADAPVLKFACAEAFELNERVAEFAPEVNRDGDFGAYIVRLRGGRG